LVNLTHHQFKTVSLVRWRPSVEQKIWLTVSATSVTHQEIISISVSLVALPPLAPSPAYPKKLQPLVKPGFKLLTQAIALFLVSELLLPLSVLATPTAEITQIVLMKVATALLTTPAHHFSTLDSLALNS
jgi:hypothetical protein